MMMMMMMMMMMVMMMVMMMMLVVAIDDDHGDVRKGRGSERERGITDWHATRQAEEDGKERSKLKGGEIG